MSDRQPRWELCRTSAGWHARFRSSNGNVIVSSEVYKNRGGAIKAINVTAGVPRAPQDVKRTHDWGVRDVGHGLEIEFGQHGLVEVREVDERD